MRSIVLVVATALWVAGCGGGGGATTPGGVDTGTGPGTPTAPNTSPTATELSQAASAQLSATLLPESAQARLSWKDTVPTAKGYRVERQQSGGTWELLQTLPTAGGGGQAIETDTAANTQGQYRVVAVLANTTVVLRTGSGADSVLVQTGTDGPVNAGAPFDPAWLASVSIELGTNDSVAEPVNGAVPLSLVVPTGWSPVSVQWFVNLKSLGAAGNASTGYGTTWNTQGLVDGSYLITARVEVQPSSFVEWRRTVVVKAPAVAASVTVSGTQGVVSVQVSASSANGIASVQTSLNNTDLGTLTAPNGCAGRCTTPNAYVYSVDTRLLPMGTYTVTSLVTDTRGERLTVTKTVSFANPPAVTIASPADGQWVHGTLAISGASVSERSVSTSITLGSVPLATSTSGAWSTIYSLAGLPAGQYVLTIRSTDAQGLTTSVQRTVTVVSDAAMVQTPLFRMGASGRLLAAQGGEVLWQDAQGVVQRRKANGDTVALADSESASLRYANDWQLEQGHVVAFGQGDDCTPLFVCVYVWDTAGQRRNLSKLVSGARNYDQHPVLRFPWVMWINQSSPSAYTLQHLVPTGGMTAQHRIAQPTGVTGTLGNFQYDFAITPAGSSGVNDDLTAFFWGTLSTDGASVVGPRADVFLWTSGNGTTQKLTASDSQQVYVQTDGQRAAWQMRSPGSVDAPYNLQVAPVSGSPATTLSTDMTRFVLRSGLLAWHEGAGGGAGGPRLMVNDGLSSQTLSTDPTASLRTVAGTAVVWSENNKLYAWTSNGGRRLLHEVASSAVVSDGAWVYLTSGQDGAVYRLALP